MLAHPVTDHFALVGTSFDYLFRFEVQRRFPKARSHTWVAEEALVMLGDSRGHDAVLARGLVRDARKAYASFIQMKRPDDEVLEQMARYSLRLAKLDSLYRSGTFDPTLEEASPRDVRDLLRMLRIVPFDGRLGMLLKKGPVLLNPTFGKFSSLIGGADADLVVGDTLVDLKSTKFPEFKNEYVAQILGYLILGEMYRKSSPRRFPAVDEVGLYFARHGVLCTIDVRQLKATPAFAAAQELLLDAAREEHSTLSVHLRMGRDAREPHTRSDDVPEPASSMRPEISGTWEPATLSGSSSGSGASGSGFPLPPRSGGFESKAIETPVEPGAVAAEPLRDTNSAASPAAVLGDTAPPFEFAITPVYGPLEQSVDGVTPYHAKFFAHEITRLAPGGDLDRISQSLFDACVDLQPHQIEAGLFALRSPISKGVMLADEVGLGKTIEAGLVLCQFWAERKRKLLVICPASIRKQWQQELTQKFDLPSSVLDSREYELLRRQGIAQPLLQDRINILSYHYASRLKDQLELVPWDLVVMDEAHRLRNAVTKASQNLRQALRPVRKLLLTATPLQNNIGELYTLASFIDDKTFGDRLAFQLQYSAKEKDFGDLRQRLAPIVKRTLRKDVLEYIRYTQRHPLTVTFDPEAPENHLYEEVSAFLQRNDTYSLPPRQRHLMVLLLRKILASSSTALAATLEKMRTRLIDLAGGKPAPEEVRDFLDDETLDEEEEEEFEETPEATPAMNPPLNPVKLQEEIRELGEFIDLARSIQVDSKSTALLRGLKEGFAKMDALGGARKALIFTESRRTQAYLRLFLEANGYRNQVVLFNGTNTEPESKAIYDEWRQANEPSGRTTGNRSIDQRTALIEYFRDRATIMLATEAAGEGVNLQFCSLVINYDLPWNPQRIEQRIGRCHRYGQKHDVVVVNFLNTKNAADRRVLELLSDKFRLFKGVFGSSDEILGTLESGVDFERKVLSIYQQCRTSREIDDAFAQLQREMEQQIRARMQKVRQALLEHFDEEVHARFRNFMTQAQNHLNRVEGMFWRTTKQVLDGKARFNDKKREFVLTDPPSAKIRAGVYRLISRTASGQLKDEGEDIIYRMSNPLGEFVLDHAKAAATPVAELDFSISRHLTRIMVLEKLKKRAGWLTLTKLRIKSLGDEEHHLFTAFTDDGDAVDPETAGRLFSLSAEGRTLNAVPGAVLARLSTDAKHAVQAQLARTMQANVAYFNDEQERLERWADDRKTSANNLVNEMEVQLRDVRRQARQAPTLKERLELKEREKQLVERQRKAQADVFTAFDEISKETEGFIETLQKQLAQSTSTETLFTVRWRVT
jgi:superfamily II DNA or RNA helicase